MPNSGKADGRDPRVDPKVGDVVRLAEDEIYTVTKVGTVWVHDTCSGGGFNDGEHENRRRDWLDFMRNAEVIHVAS